MKPIGRLFALVAVLAVSVPSPASARTHTAKVADISLGKNGWAWVKFVTNIPGTKPTCVDTPWQNYFMWDTNNAAAPNGNGVKLLNLLTAALLSGKTVEVIGGGNVCVGTSPSSVEELVNVRLIAN